MAAKSGIVLFFLQSASWIEFLLGGGPFIVLRSRGISQICHTYLEDMHPIYPPLRCGISYTYTVSEFGYSILKPVYNCSLNTNGGLECLNSATPDDHTRDLGVSCESVQNGE